HSGDLAASALRPTPHEPGALARRLLPIFFHQYPEFDLQRARFDQSGVAENELGGGANRDRFTSRVRHLSVRRRRRDQRPGQEVFSGALPLTLGNPEWLNRCLHCLVSRSAWRFRPRTSASFTPRAANSFSPSSSPRPSRIP